MKTAQAGALHPMSLWRSVTILLCLALFSAHSAADAQIDADPIYLIVGPTTETTGRAVSVAAADLDGDRFDDAVLGFEGGMVVSMLSDRFGGLATSSRLSAARDLVAIAVGHLDADTFPDLVVASRKPRGILVALGRGDGSFRGPKVISLPQNPKNMVIADTNNDGVDDIVVVDELGDVRVLGIDDGGAVPVVTLGAEPTALATGDFNSDGRVDLVTCVPSSDGSFALAVLVNVEGTGFLASQLPLDGTPVTLAVGDFDRDRRDDVAVLISTPKALSVFVNRSNAPEASELLALGESVPIPCPGTYRGIPTDCFPRDVVAVELDRHRFLGLAVLLDQRTAGSPARPGVSLGGGTFGPIPGLVQAFIATSEGLVFSTRVNVGPHPSRIAPGDLTGDRLEDLVVVENVFPINPDRPRSAVRVVRGASPPIRTDTQCSTDSQCVSGNCVDGVCCVESACDACERCDIGFGECAPLGDLGDLCFRDVQCKSSFCVDGVCCVAPGCPLGRFCSGFGECVRGFVNGHCNADEQCDPPFCVDGVCCEAASCGASERCNVPRFEGVCTDPNGPGPRSFGEPCVSSADCDPLFFCTDGVCCEDFDCGAWHRCNLPGREGTCAVLQSLVESRAVCASSEEEAIKDDGCQLSQRPDASVAWMMLLVVGIVVRWRQRARVSRKSADKMRMPRLAESPSVPL